MSFWQKIQRCWRERRWPMSVQNFAPRCLDQWRGGRHVYQKHGRKKWLRFNLDGFPGSELIFHEIYEAEIYFPRWDAYHDFRIRPGETVIDIGANIGLFTVAAANLNQSGKVYAFEPCSVNFQRLKMHVQEHQLTTVDLDPRAVTGVKGWANLHLQEGNCGAHTLDSAEADLPTERVETISLRDLFEEKNISYCDYLKMDCEGSEAKILQALPEEYFARIGRLVIEYHPGVSALALAELLRRHGFLTFLKHYPEPAGLLFAWRKNIR